MIKLDNRQLMTLALDEQWYDTRVAIAGSLLWQRRDIENEWLELIAAFTGGILPDPEDVPEIVKALRQAIDDSSSTH